MGLLKNGTYGALRWFAKLLKTDNVPGMDVPGIDFCSIAKGYGVDAVAVTSAEAFAAALRQALLNRQPYLIEVTTPSE
jgi:benzoylformate decarboxylase